MRLLIVTFITVLLFSRASAMADSELEMSPDETESVIEYYAAFADESAGETPTRIQNSISGYFGCAQALRCLSCFGSFEESCVQFNLNTWAWCLNPLNSVLIKCAQYM